MMTKRPADYITAKRSSRELARIWERIETAEEPTTFRSWGLAAALVAAAVVVAALWWREPARVEPPAIAAEPKAEEAPVSRSAATSNEATSVPSVAPPEPPPRPSPVAVAPSAKSLWARASAARRAGHSVKAAELYAALVQTHPDDARAGLAALELARMRLDRFDDAARAVEAFDFAIAHGGDAFFAEDAQAGRVEALSRLSDIEACRRARDAFLADNPDSAHASRVAGMCEE